MLDTFRTVGVRTEHYELLRKIVNSVNEKNPHTSGGIPVRVKVVDILGAIIEGYAKKHKIN